MGQFSQKRPIEHFKKPHSYNMGGVLLKAPILTLDRSKGLEIGNPLKTHPKTINPNPSK